MSSETVIIDRENQTPLAEQLRRVIKERYVNGAEPGTKLPTEHQMAKEFGVNPTLAKRALDRLRSEGVVYRRPRHGTFICENPARTLSIAYYEEAMYSFSDLLDRFERKHPYVTVSRTTLPTNAYCEIVNDLLDENRVDLVRVSAGLFPRFDAARRFSSLSSLFREFHGSTVVPVWDAFKSDRTRRAVPLAFGPVVVACNLDMFASAGVEPPRDAWSLSEFGETAKRLTRSRPNSPIPIQFGFSCPSNMNRWPMFVYAGGGSLLDQRANMFNVASKKSLLGLSYLRRMILEEKTCAPFHGASNDYRLFIRKKAAMTLISYHAIPALRPDIDFNWGLAPFPTTDGGSTDLTIADGVAVNAGTVNIEAAETFLRFCLSKEIQQHFADLGGPAPVRVGTRPSISISTPMNYELYGELPERLVFPEPLSLEARRELMEETSLYLNGLQDEEEYRSNLASLKPEC